MKKLISMLVGLTIVITAIAASDLSTSVGTETTSTLNLILKNEYSFGFTATPTIDGSVTALNKFDLKTKGSAINSTNYLQLDNSQNIFYFFYKAYTNQALKIQMSVNEPLKKNDDPSQTINFIASLQTVSGQWDGGKWDDGGSTSVALTTGSDKTTTYAKIFADDRIIDKDFNYSGVCRVIISSSENIGTKKPGNYSTNIYLNLINI